MTIASVRRYGILAAVLLWGVAAVALVNDVETGVILSVPLLVASMGVADAVRIVLTRTWPKVEADVVDQDEQTTLTTSTRSEGAVTRYAQQLSYDYQGQRRNAALTWTTAPPSQVVLRVNPADPREVFCLEHAGNNWVFFLLVALLLPLAVGLTLSFGLSRLPRFLAGLAVLAGIAVLGGRLHPADRADTLASRGVPSEEGNA
jgi:hypothetical protein